LEAINNRQPKTQASTPKRLGQEPAQKVPFTLSRVPAAQTDHQRPAESG